MKQCNNLDGEDKLVINIKYETTIGHIYTQHNFYNRDFKINSAIILTFVFANRDAGMVAVKIKKMCVNMNKGRGYVVVYRSKKSQVYCEYKEDIQCDRTVVRYILPLCSLIGKINKQ